MTTQPSWIPLNQRSEDIQEKVKEVYKELANKEVFSEALDLYLEYEWGQLRDGLLYRGLLESKRTRKCLTANEIKQLAPPPNGEGRADENVRDEDGIIVDPVPADEIGQSLKWFRANAPNSKVKEKAEDEFKIRLLELYIAHVSKTGETYFPPLEESLRIKADFYDD